MILGALAVTLTGLSNCRSDASNAPTSQKEAGRLKGVTLSPLSYDTSGFTGFFEIARQAGGVISWAGDWAEANETNGGPIVLAELAEKYDYTSLVELQFFTQSTGLLLRGLDESTRRTYREGAVALVRKYRMKYLAVGIEVNTLYAKSPADFDAFVQLFGEVYHAVKAASPNTRVFTIFQLEMMKGLNGGLFGGVNDATEAQWMLLDRFRETDIVGFTTYPGLVYRAPQDLPADYYSEIRNHTSKPVAFTEIGWHSQDGPPGWESTEYEQAEFVRTFSALSSSLRPELRLWSFLYDQDSVVPFSSMGLYSRDGVAKLAWDSWISAP
jgi:hypothetical protein